MLFGRKKISVIDRRLEELRREMAKVGTDIKSVSRYAKKAGEPPAAAGGAGQAVRTPPVPAGKSESPIPLSVPENKESTLDADNAVSSEQGMDKLVSAGDLSPGESASGLPLFEQRSPISMTGREKFANYFMAGHFSNLRPLRQEKRIIRNKAIIWVILAALALIWLFFFVYYQ